jgi:hypothetical protein
VTLYEECVHLSEQGFSLSEECVHLYEEGVTLYERALHLYGEGLHASEEAVRLYEADFHLSELSFRLSSLYKKRFEKALRGFHGNSKALCQDFRVLRFLAGRLTGSCLR